MAKSKYVYGVRGLERLFDTKAEAFRQARNLGAAARECCERLGKKFEGIEVYQYERESWGQPDPLVESKKPRAKRAK